MHQHIKDAFTVLLLTATGLAAAQSCTPIDKSTIEREQTLLSFRSDIPRAEVNKVHTKLKVKQRGQYVILDKQTGVHVMALFSHDGITKADCASLNQKYAGSADIPTVPAPAVEEKSCMTQGLSGYVRAAQPQITAAGLDKSTFRCVAVDGRYRAIFTLQ